MIIYLSFIKIINMDRLFSSILGASFAEIITFPICTIKTIYQVENKPVKDCISKLKTNKYMIMKALYPSILTQIYSSTYKLCLFTQFQSCFEKTWQLLLLGSLISCSSLLVTHPLDYIKVSYQTNQNITMKDCWKGISPNLMKQSLAGMFYLPVRQSIKNNFPDLKSWQAGVATAIIGTTIVHPFDYFKTYLLGNNIDSKIDIRKSYRGLHLNLLRVIPHFVIMTESSDYIYRKYFKS